MKMETIITATISGIVESLHAQPLDSVNAGDLLVTIVPAATSGAATPRPSSPVRA
jgi:multidrug resistance efflux pump